MRNLSENEVRAEMIHFLRKRKIRIESIPYIHFKEMTCTQDFYHPDYQDRDQLYFKKDHKYCTWIAPLDYNGGCFLISEPYDEIIDTRVEPVYMVPLRHFTNNLKDKEIRHFDHYNEGYTKLKNSRGFSFLVKDEMLSSRKVCDRFGITLKEDYNNLELCILGSSKYLNLGWRYSEFIGGAWRFSYLDILEGPDQFIKNKYVGGAPMITEIPLPLDQEWNGNIIFGGGLIQKKLVVTDPLQKNLSFA